MWNCNRWIITVLIGVCLLLSACGQTTSDNTVTPPAKVEHIVGKDISRVLLTADAIKRLGIETILLHDMQVSGKSEKGVPYSAVLYDLKGDTWVYTNPESRTFVRNSISVDSIVDNLAILSAGPPSGTAIVTVGASELYGTELGVGDEA